MKSKNRFLFKKIQQHTPLDRTIHISTHKSSFNDDSAYYCKLDLGIKREILAPYVFIHKQLMNYFSTRKIAAPSHCQLYRYEFIKLYS